MQIGTTIKLPENLKHGLDEFITSCRLDRGAATNTIISYKRDLIQFFNWLHELDNSINSVEKIGTEHINQFIEFTFSDGNKPSSRARKISSIKQFFKFCCLEELLVLDPAQNIGSPKQDRQVPKALSRQDMDKLLQAVHTGFPYGEKSREKLHGRDQAMITLLYATGLRVSELVNLSLYSIEHKNCFLRTIGKGGKERLVPFPPQIASLIGNYITNIRPLFNPATQHLFLNTNGANLTRQAFWKTLGAYSKMAGLSVSPHIIRHSFATHLLQGGMDLRALQLILGHSDLATTQIYTKITPDHLKRAHQKYHPRGE